MAIISCLNRSHYNASGGEQFKDGITRCNSRECLDARTCPNREIPLNRHLEAIQVLLEDLKLLNIVQRTKSKPHTASAFLEPHIPCSSGIADPLCFAPRCDEETLTAHVEHIDGRGINAPC